MVTHAPDADPFWNVVKNGIADAQQDFGVKVDYRNPSNGDLADMTRLLEQAGARHYDGVATTIADFDVIQRPVKTIVEKGDPVITFNSGTGQQSRQLGALLHVGQPEYEAGKEAGERAKAAGVKSFLCVNNNATNPVSFERCRGFADAIGADFKKATLDSGNDPTEVENKVFAALHARPETQAVLALGPTSAVPSLRAIRKLGLVCRSRCRCRCGTKACRRIRRRGSLGRRYPCGLNDRRRADRNLDGYACRSDRARGSSRKGRAVRETRRLVARTRAGVRGECERHRRNGHDRLQPTFRFQLQCAESRAGCRGDRQGGAVDDHVVRSGAAAALVHRGLGGAISGHDDP
ncbi:substrate-binding domain-containing protein [Paraburkholderia sp. NMBU_R16]|nr:substrate-binding domain-containing protein [Paraburkholderia sp. NMBU_R16]